MIRARNLTYAYVLLATVALCAFAMTAHAASGLNCAGGTCTYTPLEPLPTGDANAQNGQNFPAFVSGLFRVLITFGGLFAVVMLVVAGIGYMLSESALDIDKAKDRAKAALWGLLLLAGSWLILNTINPELLNFKLLLPKSGTTQISNPVAPAANATPTCLGTECLSDQQKLSLQNAQQLQNTGLLNTTLSNDTINQTIQDKQTIAAGEATTCKNNGGEVWMGALFNNGCSEGAKASAAQSGYTGCTAMAAGGVCLTK